MVLKQSPQPLLCQMLHRLFETWALINHDIQFWTWASSSGLEHPILILGIHFWGCTQSHFCPLLRVSDSVLVYAWCERNSIPLHRINFPVDIFFGVNRPSNMACASSIPSRKQRVSFRTKRRWETRGHRYSEHHIPQKWCCVVRLGMHWSANLPSVQDHISRAYIRWYFS